MKVGALNETHAQITEGLDNGVDVKILQVGEGQELLERAGIKVAPPSSTQPAGERGERASPPPGMRPPGICSTRM